MSLKTLNNLLKFTDVGKIYKKFLNYFSIFTIVLGTTFGSINSANADNIGAALTWDSETGAAVFNVANGVLTIIAPATKRSYRKSNWYYCWSWYYCR